MTYIYFVQETLTNSIKIGLSADIGKRIVQLQLKFPHKLTLIGLMEGNLETEKELNLKFESHKLNKEWFNPASEILEFIEKNAKLKEIPMNLKKALEDMKNRSTEDGAECKKLMELSQTINEPEECMVTVEKAADLLGVTSATLRNWDKAGKLVPQKTIGGHRRYTMSQIQDIRKKMMMGMELIIPSISAKEIIAGTTALLNNFEPEEKVNVSIRHDTLTDKIRITIDSADGLSTVTKSFNIKE